MTATHQTENDYGSTPSVIMSAAHACAWNWDISAKDLGWGLHPSGL